MEVFYIILFLIIGFVVGWGVNKTKVNIDIQVKSSYEYNGIKISKSELKQLITIIRNTINELYPNNVQYISRIKIDFCNEDNLYLYLYSLNTIHIDEKMLDNLRRIIKERTHKFTIVNSVKDSYIITDKNNNLCSEI